MRACVRVCAWACVCVRVRARVCVCACVVGGGGGRRAKGMAGPAGASAKAQCTITRTRTRALRHRTHPPTDRDHTYPPPTRPPPSERGAPIRPPSTRTRTPRAAPSPSHLVAGGDLDGGVELLVASEELNQQPVDARDLLGRRDPLDGAHRLPLRAGHRVLQGALRLVELLLHSAARGPQVTLALVELLTLVGRSVALPAQLSARRPRGLRLALACGQLVARLGGGLLFLARVLARFAAHARTRDRGLGARAASRWGGGRAGWRGDGRAGWGAGSPPELRLQVLRLGLLFLA